MNQKNHQLNIQGPDTLSLDLVEYPSLASYITGETIRVDGGYSISS